MVQSSFLNIGITFAIFKLLGKVQDVSDKLATNDIGLLSAVWNNFRNLLGILEGPVDLLFLSYFITDNTLSLLVGDIKKEPAFGFFRYSEYLWFCFIKFSSIFWQWKWSVYWIHLQEFLTVLLPFWIDLISLARLLEILTISLIPFNVLIKFN